MQKPPYLSRVEFELAVAEHRRRVIPLYLVGLALVALFVFVLPYLLVQISPKRAGALTWIGLMSLVFAGALQLGRRIDRVNAATRVACPNCEAVLSNTWRRYVGEHGRCPHCQEQLLAER